MVKILHKFNIRIPEDIAVVGFSNSLSSKIIQPNLTTVNQPGNMIGKTAAKFLIKEIENDDNELSNATVAIETNLIVRETTFKL